MRLRPGRGDQIKARWRIATDPRRTADEYAVWLHQLLELEGFGRGDVGQVIIGTVVPRALHNLEVLSEKYFGVEPLVAGRARPNGRSRSMSTSRRASAPTARSMPSRPRQASGRLDRHRFRHRDDLRRGRFFGAYKGGIIAPGINLSLDALVGAAAKLPRIAIAVPHDESVVGRTTETQMLIGVYWGYVAMIEGLVARMKAEIGRPVTVIATGGLAILFDKHTGPV